MRILDAFTLASSLHAGQVDKAGRPYIEHLSRVFLRVLQAGGDRDQQIAALLHDAVEDGRTTFEQLAQVGVPSESIEIVRVLTKPRDTDYDTYVAGVLLRPRALMVKRADLEDNSDPVRLAALPSEVAERLRTKYARALQMVTAGTPEFIAETEPQAPRRVDPALVTPSSFDGRHADALRGDAFRVLKESVQHACGNLTPIIVRPSAGGGLVLVHGRRRLQACLELGLAVDVDMRSYDERRAFEVMVGLREASGSWSLYELGVSLRTALDAGLYPSTRRVADACGITLTRAVAALDAATLPSAVLAAFGSPTAITRSAVAQLRKALDADAERIVRAAVALAAQRGSHPLSATKVLASLCTTA